MIQAHPDKAKDDGKKTQEYNEDTARFGALNLEALRAEKARLSQQLRQAVETADAKLVDELNEAKLVDELIAALARETRRTDAEAERADAANAGLLSCCRLAVGLLQASCRLAAGLLQACCHLCRGAWG
jgi:hypothetical protein